jgi:aspartyl-tRNA(Asn)/glutamyl-tRNA(Gln) amidotransferase subunit A
LIRDPAAKISGKVKRALHFGMVLDDDLIDVDVRDRMLVAASVLCELGCSVKSIHTPWRLSEIDALWGVLSSAGAARIAGRFDPQEWARLATEPMQSLAKVGAEVSAAAYIEALDQLQVLRREAAMWFSPHAFILTPTSPCPAWQVNKAFPEKIGQHPAGPRSVSSYSVVANAGGLPALSVPIGMTSASLPVGLQIIGPFRSDAQLLSIGRLLQAH